MHPHWLVLHMRPPRGRGWMELPKWARQARGLNVVSVLRAALAGNPGTCPR